MPAGDRYSQKYHPARERPAPAGKSTGHGTLVRGRVPRYTYVAELPDADALPMHLYRTLKPEEQGVGTRSTFTNTPEVRSVANGWGSACGKGEALEKRQNKPCLGIRGETGQATREPDRKRGVGSDDVVVLFANATCRRAGAGWSRGRWYRPACVSFFGQARSKLGTGDGPKFRIQRVQD